MKLINIIAEPYRQLADTLPVFIWVAGVDSKCVYFNRPWLEFRGRTLQQELGDGWAEGVHPDDMSRCVTTYRSSFDKRKPFELEYRLKRADGAFRWVLDAGKPIFDGTQFEGYIGSTVDITAQKQTSVLVSQPTEPRHFEQLLRSVVDHTIDGIISINEVGKVQSFNKAAETIFGYTPQEVIGQNVKMLMPQPYHGEHDGYLVNYMRTGEAKVIGIGREVVGRRKDGSTFPMDLAISEFSLDGTRHFTGLVRDISERKRLEEQLRQSQKMEAVGQLAGGIAHDFNNLLTVINGYSELLIGLLPPADPKQASLRAIADAGAQAEALTRQLLAFSRKSVLEPQVVNLNDLVRDTERMLRRLIGEDIALNTVLEPKPHQVKVDPGQISQVLMNLVVNSRDAMPQGGKITVETKNTVLDRTYTSSHYETIEGRYVVMSVTDTGTGMPPDVQARVFEPFYTTKGVGKGTGLGLAVVHGIVKQSGGHVEVYSELNIGTTFKIYLPAVDTTSALASGITSAAHVPSGKETILIVEDADAVRDIATLALTTFGYTVISARDGREAIELAAKHSGKIDLVMTDVVMPEMSGRQVADALRPMLPGVKVLFVSGYTDDAVIRHGILKADVAFLQKPYTPTSLVKKVRQMLDQK